MAMTLQILAIIASLDGGEKVAHAESCLFERVEEKVCALLELKHSHPVCTTTNCTTTAPPHHCAPNGNPPSPLAGWRAVQIKYARGQSKGMSMSFVLELVFELEYAGLALFRRILLLPLALFCLR